MRKKKPTKNYVIDELADANISTPAPDFEMIYNGSDMYWYPSIDAVNKAKSKDNSLEDILLLN